MFITFLLVTLHFVDVYCALPECNHLQYSTGELVVINQCLASSVDGITTSHIISWDESEGVFTKDTYYYTTCDPEDGLKTTQQISPNMIQSSKTNATDCSQIFRVYDSHHTMRTCAQGGDFEDIGVIRGYEYLSDNSCASYDCDDEYGTVTIIDCLIREGGEFGSESCVTLNGERQYFDTLLHCGEKLFMRFFPYHITTTTTTSSTTTTSTTSTTTKRPKRTETSAISDMKPPTTAHHNAADDIQTSIITTNSTEYANGGNNLYKMYILPALPIQALGLVITLFLSILSGYHVYFHEESKKVDPLLKAFIMLTFLFNVLGIACIFAFSIIIHLFLWTPAKRVRDMALILYYGASVCYVLGKFCLEFVFLLRVYTAFRNNIFRLSNFVLYSLFCWMFICCVLWLLLLISDNRHWSASHYLYIVTTVSDVILVVVLLYMFTVRLQTLVIRETVAMRAVPKKLTVRSHTPAWGSNSTTTKPYTPTALGPNNMSIAIKHTPALILGANNTSSSIKTYTPTPIKLRSTNSCPTTPVSPALPPLATNASSTVTKSFPSKPALSLNNNHLSVNMEDLQKCNTPTLTPLPTLSHTSQISASHPSMTTSGEFPRISMSMADSMQFKISCVMDANDLIGIKSDLHSQNSSLISLMTKLVLLSSISLITTAVFGVYLFAEVSLEEKVLYVSFALWCIDICINSICLFLNFGFSDAIYKKLCRRPDAATQWIIETIFITKIVMKTKEQTTE